MLNAAPTQTSRTRRPATRYVVIGVVALLAVLGAVLGPRLYSGLTDTTAKDRIAAEPPPTLFAATTTARVDRLTSDQGARAQGLMTAWWTAHGTTADDAAFVTWLEQTLPGPPPEATRTAEMTEIERLDAQRTPEGVAAATWLEGYGKKDVWKLQAHDQAEWIATPTGDARKNAVDDLLSMTKTVADAVGLRDQQSAPYVLEPSLRTDHTVVPGDVCPCSYPSRHATAAAASRTYLGHLDPQRDNEYRYWEDQIDYSRLYMAGHVPSDITGGALLGDMIGQYFLTTREGVQPDQS